MPRKKGIPSYRKHSSGKARVTINGKDYMLGEYGSEESHKKYAKLIEQWQASSAPAVYGATGVSVAEVVEGYSQYAKAFYGDHSKSEYVHSKPVLRIALELYGEVDANDFGKAELKAVRQKLIDQGLARSYINKQMQRLVRAFGWASEDEDLVDPVITARLRSVRGLQPGNFGVRETDEVEPVPVEVVEQTLDVVPRIIADMVQVQLLTGCRPGEVCKLTPGMISRSGEVWEANLKKHKTRHHGKKRCILIGPQAQDIIRPYLLRDPNDPLFSPAESVKRFREKQRASRKSKVQPSQRDRSKGKRRKAPGMQYTTDSYRDAIERACEKHGIPHWTPNQLRHTRATYLREVYGLDVAGAVLGHSNLEVTLIYAEQSRKKAAAAMLEVG